MVSNKRENKILSLFVISILISIFLMFFVSALKVELSNPSNANPEQGEIVNFVYSLKIYSGETLGGNIEVHREGDLCLLCKANIQGASLGCEGASIVKISEVDNYLNQHEPRVGINDGGIYSNTEYTYNITINTSNLKLERYNIFVRAENLYRVFNTDTKSFTVKEAIVSNQTDNNQTCNENWVCTNLSNCINNLKTRTCTDLNSCNTTKNKPFETQYCIQNQTIPYVGGLENLTSDLGINFEINSSSNGKIAIIRYKNIENLNLTNIIGVLELGKWFEINLMENSTGSLDYIIIKAYYTDEDILSAGIDESTLRLYYYNTSNSWEKYNGENGGVNTEENYVWAKTNHLSLWGIYGNAIVVVQPISSGGGGGSGSSSSGGGIIYLKKNNQSITNTTIANNYSESLPKKEELKEETNVEKEKVNKISKITGAVIGFTRTKLGIGLVFAVIIIILGISILSLRNQKNKESSTPAS